MVSCCHSFNKVISLAITSWGEIPLLRISGGRLVGIAVLAYGQSKCNSQTVSGLEKVLPGRRKARRGKRKPHARARRKCREVDNLAPSSSRRVISDKSRLESRAARRELRQAVFVENKLDRVRRICHSVKQVEPIPEWKVDPFDVERRRECYARYRIWRKGYLMIERRLRSLYKLKKEVGYITDVVDKYAAQDRKKFPIEQFRTEPTVGLRDGWKVSGFAQVAPPIEKLLPDEKSARIKAIRKGPPGGRRFYMICPSCLTQVSGKKLRLECVKCHTVLDGYVEWGPGYLSSNNRARPPGAREIESATCPASELDEYGACLYCRRIGTPLSSVRCPKRV